jgi:hypothetical protein
MGTRRSPVNEEALLKPKVQPELKDTTIVSLHLPISKKRRKSPISEESRLIVPEKSYRVTGTYKIPPTKEHALLSLNEASYLLWKLARSEDFVSKP